MSVTCKSLKQLETVQGNLVKQALGISKRSRSSDVLQALNICKVEDIIHKNTASLMYRIFLVESPIRNLAKHFLSAYIARGVVIPGTIVDRLITYGLSPTKCAFFKGCRHSHQQNCGVVDSLRVLFMHQNFIKPYSEEHVLAALLTKSFNIIISVF